MAEYRLAAEISAAQAVQAAAAAAGVGSDRSALGDGWYQPLLAGAAAGAGGDGGQEGTEQAGGTRGVYSFCMCPGGQIVPTSTDEGELCINGMSFSRCARWGTGRACEELVSAGLQGSCQRSHAGWAPCLCLVRVHCIPCALDD